MRIKNKLSPKIYRTRILANFNYDIKKHKDKLKGGRADEHNLTDFDIEELLLGISVEQEHTNDIGIALEIACDHLAELPDYYTRLQRMERNGKEYWEDYND